MLKICRNPIEACQELKKKKNSATFRPLFCQKKCFATIASTNKNDFSKEKEKKRTLFNINNVVQM